MQVFVIGTPLQTAKSLDSKRLHKQVIECRQILNALSGGKAWSNHPCTLQYENHQRWLKYYMWCLEDYISGNIESAMILSKMSTAITPKFHTEEYLTQMKRRLYTKNPSHYKEWEHLGKSEENWYYVDGTWRKYQNGKRI